MDTSAIIRTIDECVASYLKEQIHFRLKDVDEGICDIERFEPFAKTFLYKCVYEPIGHGFYSWLMKTIPTANNIGMYFTVHFIQTIYLHSEVCIEVPYDFANIDLESAFNTYAWAICSKRLDYWINEIRMYFQTNIDDWYRPTDICKYEIQYARRALRDAHNMTIQEVNQAVFDCVKRLYRDGLGEVDEETLCESLMEDFCLWLEEEYSFIPSVNLEDAMEMVRTIERSDVFEVNNYDQYYTDDYFNTYARVYYEQNKEEWIQLFAMNAKQYIADY